MIAISPCAFDIKWDETRKVAEPRGSWILVEECRCYSVGNEEGVALEPGSDTLQLCWSVECFRGERLKGWRSAGRPVGPETRCDNGLTQQ